MCKSAAAAVPRHRVANIKSPASPLEMQMQTGAGAHRKLKNATCHGFFQKQNVNERSWMNGRIIIMCTRPAAASKDEWNN